MLFRIKEQASPMARALVVIMRRASIRVATKRSTPASENRSFSRGRPRCLFSSALLVALLSVLVGHLKLSGMIMILLDKFAKSIQTRNVHFH